MPWFPDFVSAAELVRRQARDAGQADPVGQYFTALNKGDTHVLETVWPGEVDGRRHVRPPALKPGQAHPGDVVGRYQAALDAGDAEAVVNTFAPDGYYREPIGPHYTHRGTAELRSFFTRRFSAGGGIGLQHCAVTDDGVRCALEYNCVRWGSHVLPPQAGLGVYERGPDGLLAAARVYDDVELDHSPPPRPSRAV
jgi:ketosteroid isomerase-like protein